MLYMDYEPRTREEIVCMLFYRGYIYDVWTAVYPVSKGISYRILDVRDNRKRKTAYIKCGFDRMLQVTEKARLIMRIGLKTKIIKIPFEKAEGRMTFDLAKYLSDNSIRYKIYKREGKNCAGDKWNEMAYELSICKNGEILWGSDWCIDYREFWINIIYTKNYPCIGGKELSKFVIQREINRMDSEDIRNWFENSMVERINITWKELGAILDELGIHKTNHFFDIYFRDGTSLRGSEIDWEECEKLRTI